VYVYVNVGVCADVDMYDDEWFVDVDVDVDVYVDVGVDEVVR